MDLFGRKKDHSVSIGIVSSAIGAAVGAVTTMLLMDPKNRKAVSSFVNHMLETTTKKGEEVIDMTTKTLEKNAKRKSRNTDSPDETA